MMKSPPLPLGTELARQRAIQAVQDAPSECFVTIAPPPRKRTQEQLFWARCGELARTLKWHGKLWPKEAWADVFYAAWQRERGLHASFMPGIDNSPVRMGRATSALSDAEYGEMLSLQDVFLAEQEVAA